MTRVTLYSIENPDTHKIRSIKALREANNGFLGLREAKEIVEDVASGTNRVVDVIDEQPLSGLFRFERVEEPSDPGVPKALVFDFLLDVLAWSAPSTARQITREPSYQALREALL